MTMRRVLANTNKLKSNQMVNALGKYLYNHIDGAFKIKNTGNTCDVWMTLLYAVPTEELQKGDVQDVHEMTLNLSITTYQNKIRVNILEVTPNEKTLACQVYKPEQLEDFALATKVIFDKIIKRVEKVYEDFEILY